MAGNRDVPVNEIVKSVPGINREIGRRFPRKKDGVHVRVADRRILAAFVSQRVGVGKVSGYFELIGNLVIQVEPRIEPVITSPFGGTVLIGISQPPVIAHPVTATAQRSIVRSEERRVGKE